MKTDDRTNHYCVIGAGPSGLTAIKNLRQRGIGVECYEREDDVGGNWYYGRSSSNVYASTHLISSKRQTEFTDFPMPKSFPPFPSHRQALDYLRDYANAFDLVRHIQFCTSVVRIEPQGNRWLVTLDNDQPPRSYAGVIIANGHHWDPLVPEIPGTFTGTTLHAKQYKTPDLFEGKRVLIVGAGNSGCDIAVEAAAHAESASLSMRRGYHFLPKFMLGRPIDSCHQWMHRWGFPLWLRRWAAGWMVRIAVGPPDCYGLPAPDHKLFETHPIINSQLLYNVGHGRLQIRPDVQQFEGEEVRFVDESSDRFDMVIYATGYQVTFPFIDREHLHSSGGSPPLFMNIFHPKYDNLFVAGMVQPDGGLWGLTDDQCQLIGDVLLAQRHDLPLAKSFRQKWGAASSQGGSRIHYVDSPRHAIEVEYYGYRRLLSKHLHRFRHLKKHCPPQG